MKIPDPLVELQNYFSNMYVKSLKEKDPEELDKLTELLNNMTEVAIHVLRESPEFREKFAKIHREFLKYPEANPLIEDSKEVYIKYNKKN